MKIALVHKRLDKSGGTELDFYRTAAGLRDLGHEVHLFCSELLPKIVPEPDHLFELSDCEIIKDEKKIKVAGVKVEIESSVKTVYVKRYNAHPWRYRFGRSMVEF